MIEEPLHWKVPEELENISIQKGKFFVDESEVEEWNDKHFHFLFQNNMLLFRVSLFIHKV